MDFKKFNFLFIALFSLCFLIFSSVQISAVFNADYTVVYSIQEPSGLFNNTNLPVNGASVRAHYCLNSACTLVNPVPFYSATAHSGSNIIRVVFPTTLVGYRYSIYVYKSGYIGYERHGITYAGNGDVSPSNPIQLSRKRIKSANLTNFNAVNYSDCVNLSANVNSPISDVRYTNVPLLEQASVLATFEVLKNGVPISASSNALIIDYSGNVPVSFNYCGLTTGNYTFLLHSDITDAKIITSVRDTKNFSLIIPPNECEEGDISSTSSFNYCYNAFDIWTNITQEVCRDNSWVFETNPLFNSTCDTSIVNENVYCVGNNLTTNISGPMTPACLFGECRRMQWQEVVECDYDCVNGECVEGCVDGTIINSLAVNYCLENSVWTNTTYQLCEGNSWIDSSSNILNETCSGEIELENQFCEGNNLTQNWSQPICVESQGECSYEYFTNSSACEYECANDMCVNQCDEDGDCQSDYLESLCFGDFFVTTNNDFFCNLLGNCDVEIVNVSTENCFNNDVDYSDYFCEGNNLTRNVTHYLGGCDNSQGCYVDSYLTIDQEYCDYGCNSETLECNEPSDGPTCSVDYLANVAGYPVFSISNYYFNQTGSYYIYGSADSNSDIFILKTVVYNRTDWPVWQIANPQDFWSNWASNEHYLGEGNHTVCCKASSQKCDGPDNCEIKMGEVLCEEFCIDTQAPIINITSVPGMNSWNSSSFNWEFSVSDLGCAGLNHYDVSLRDLNGSSVNHEDYNQNSLLTENLVNNHSYYLYIVAVDNAGNSRNLSSSLLTMNITQPPLPNCTEGSNQTQVCSVGIGACYRTGIQISTCSSGIWSNWSSCSAVAGLPSGETCNGVDDDCDGLVDEGLDCGDDDNGGSSSGSTIYCSNRALEQRTSLIVEANNTDTPLNLTPKAQRTKVNPMNWLIILLLALLILVLLIIILVYSRYY